MSRSIIRPSLGAIVSLANADPIPLDLGNSNIPGQIYRLANDSRFSETYFSEPLTTYGVGYKDPNDLVGALEFFSPTTQVPGRLFEFKKWSNPEEFYSEVDDVRAIGADFKRVEFTGQDQTAKTQNKGLTMRVDLDNVVQVPGWENRYVAKLIRRLLRNELRRSIGILSAAAVNTAKTWNPTTNANADPDQDVLAEESLAADDQGFAFNRVGYGHSSWVLRSQALRSGANAAKFATAGMTAEQLAGWLAVDDVYVSKERYQSSSTAKTQLVGNTVLMFTAMPGQDIEDPSNIKRFVSPPPNLQVGGKPYERPAGGLDINVYLQQISSKLVDISVEHYSLISLTSSLGIRSFTTS